MYFILYLSLVIIVCPISCTIILQVKQVQLMILSCSLSPTVPPEGENGFSHLTHIGLPISFMIYLSLVLLIGHKVKRLKFRLSYKSFLWLVKICQKLDCLSRPCLIPSLSLAIPDFCLVFLKLP